MKILITGAQGQVGSATVEQFTRDDRNEVVSLSRNELDITSRDQVFTAVSQLCPDVIVNAAAMTNVDACEDNLENAFAINALGVRNLTQASRLADTHLIHLSTDFVFDGFMSRPYTEFDIANPLSVYATSKLGGDTEALAYSNSTVLRVAWVFGDPGGDFFSWVTSGVKDGSITSLIDDQTSTPTYSYDIAKVIQYCASHRLNGLYNVANVGEATRLDMGRAVCKRLGIDNALAGIPASTLNRPAARPMYSALSTDVLTKVTGIHMRPWEDALEDHIEKMISIA